MTSAGRQILALGAGAASQLAFVVIGYALEVNGAFDRLVVVWPVWYWWFPLGSLVGGAVMAAISRRPKIHFGGAFLLLQAALTWGMFDILDLMSSGHKDPRMQPILLLEIPSTLVGAFIVYAILSRRRKGEQEQAP